MSQTPQTRVLFKHTLSKVLMGVFAAFLALVALTSVVTLLPRHTEAAASKTLNFQARLLNGSGAIVPDGVYNVEFKLYKSQSSGASAQGVCVGGVTDDCVWKETRLTTDGASLKVNVRAGYVSVYLGDKTDLPSTIWNQQLWLTMNIGGTGGSPSWDGEMSPRLRLTAVPAAYSLTQYNSATGYSSSLSIAGATGGDQNFTIPDQGAAGTYSLLTNLSGIQNQIAVQQSASSAFWIGGSGRSDTSFLTPLLDTPSGTTTLNVGTTNATSGISLNQNTSIATGKTLTVVAGATTLTGASGGGATTLTVNTGAATNVGALIKAAASQSANTFEIRDDSNNLNLAVNAAGNQLTLGKLNTTAGTFVLNSGTSNFSGTITLNTLTADRKFILPDTGLATTASPGTICVYNGTNSNCPAATGSTAYIQNSTTVMTDANYYIRSFDVASPVGVLEGKNGQTADLLNLNTYNGTTSTTVARFTNVGNLQIAGTIDTVTGTALNIGDASSPVTTAINLNQNTTIASGKTLTVTSGATILTGATSGDALTISNSTSTGNIAVFKDNATAVLTVADGGSVALRPTLDSTTAFNIKNQASNGNLLTVDSSNSRVGINLGSNNVPNSTLEVNGTLRLSGSATENFLTPQGINVVTKINVPLLDPGAYGQVLAFGLPSSATSTARAISIFDGRTAAHQPTIGVFSPDENNMIGFNWNGTNTNAAVQTNDGTTTTSAMTLQSGNAASVSGTNTGNVTLKSGDVNGGVGGSSGTVYIKTGDSNSTTGGSGGIVIDAGAPNVGGTGGTITVGTTNASAVGISRTGVTTTVNGALTVAEATSFNGNVTIGNATADRLTVTSQILGQDALVFQGATDNGFTTTLRFTDPTANNIITFPDTSGTVQLAPASGSYLLQVPTSNTGGNAGANVVSPTAASIVGLTVNATTGTSASAAIFNQANNTSPADTIQVNSTNTSGTQTNGLIVNRNGVGGTTTNGINITNTAGTLTNGLAFTGTIGTDIYRSSGTLTLQGVGGLSGTSSNTSGAASGAITLQSGNVTSGAFASGDITIDVGTSTGTLGAINIGHTGVTTTVSGTLRVGASAGTGAFVNNGTTLNTVTTQSTGSSTSISNINSYSAFVLTATTGGLSYTLPDPSPTTAGKIVYISNASTGSNAFTLAPTNGTSILLNTGVTATMMWNGVRWTYAGTDASNLQNAYANSVGSTTPEIILDSTRNGLDIQDINGGLGSTTALFAVRAGSVGGTNGNPLFTVTNSGANTGTPLVGIGVETASRALHVKVSNSVTGAPPLLVEQASATGDASLEFKNPNQSFYLGVDTSDGSKFKINSSTGTGAQSVLGNDTIGSSTDSSDSNTENVMKWVAATSGTVSTSYAYVSSPIGSNPNNRAKMAIYADSGTGYATSPLGISNETTLTADSWNSFTFGTPVNITAGTTYWIAYNTNGTAANQNNLRFTSGGVSVGDSQYYTAGTSYATTPFPTNGSAGTAGNPGQMFSMYASVVASASDTFSASLFQLTASGAATFQNSSNSSSAFRVLNVAGTQVLQADTTNSRVGINLSGSETPSFDLSFGGGADQVIGVNQRTTTGAGRSLTVQGGQGNAGAGGALTLQGGAGQGTNQGGGAVNIAGGTATGSGTRGAVNINASAGGSATNIGTGTTTGAIGIGNSAAGAITIQSGAAINSTAGAASTVSTTAGTLTLQGFAGTNVTTPATNTASTNSSAVTISTGNATGTTSTAGNISLDNGTSTTGTPQINIGNSNQAHQINIGAGGTSTVQTVTVGSTGSTSTLTLQAGTGTAAGDLTLQTAAGGIINIGGNAVNNKVLNLGSVGTTNAASTVNIATTNANQTQSVNIGNTGSANSAILLQGGSSSTAIQMQVASGGTINIANNAVSQNVLIGNGTGGTIRVGQNGGTLQLDGTNFDVSTAGVVTLAGGQTADITTAGAGTATAITLQPGTSTTNSGTGAALNLYGGNQSGTTSTGGAVNIQGGTGTTTNGAINIGASNTSAVTLGATGITTTANGTLRVGASAGAGAFVNNGTTLNTVNTQSFGVNGSIANVDTYSAFVITATAGSLTITLPNPSPTTAGKIVYISNNSSGSNMFTLSPTSGTAMLLNTGATTTLMWNGSAWTYAGTDGSAILNQNSADQTANFRILGTGQITGSASGTNTLLTLSTNNANNTGLRINTVGTATNALEVYSAVISKVVASFDNAGDLTLGTTGASSNAAGSIIISDGQTATAKTLTLKTAQGATGNYSVTLDPTLLSGNRVYKLPDLDGTIALTSTTSGYFLQQVPSSNTAGAAGANVVSPTAASIVGLTVNATTGTSASAAIFNQANGTSPASTIQVNSTNTAGTQTDGLLVNRNGAGGITTNGITVQQSAGTLTNGINIAGTVGTGLKIASTSTNAIDITGTISGNLINATNFKVSTAGVVTLAGNQAADITSTANTQISVQPGATTSANGLAQLLRLVGGDSTSASCATLCSGGNVLVQGGAGTGGSGNSYGGDVYLRAGTGRTTAMNGQIHIGDINTFAIDIGATGITTTTNGTLRVGGSAGTGAFINNGTTLNTVKTYTNFASNSTIDTAANSVDLYTAFTINQTTASITLTLPTPTTTTAGKIIYVSNIGTAAFQMSGATVNAGATATLVWTGSAWSFAGADSSNLQLAYNNSAGGTVAEMIVNNGGANTGGIDIQDATAGTIGATNGLLTVRGVGTANTLGSSLFQVNNNANSPLVGIGLGTQTASTGIDLQFGGSANRTIQVLTNTSSGAGRDLTVKAGTGNGSFVGGNLNLQGGIAGATNINGGDVVITGGGAVGGTGVQGLVKLAPTAFTSIGSTVSITGTTTINTASANAVNLYSTIPVSANNIGYTLTVDAPTNAVIGRILYVSNVGSNDFTLLLSGTSVTIALKPNSTATLVWNGTGWTAAGASSSTDLQAAYNNTATSAGGAELVLNASGGAADGLTIRNNGTTPINGGIFEVQSAIGTNLFSVNNLGTELAANGGAETSGTFTTNWTAAPAGGTATRTTTSGQYVTGQAGVSVTTTTTAATGVRNNLSGNPVVSTTYQVSFTAKLASGTFTDLEVLYSRNGGTNTQACASYSTQTLSTTVWTKITCTITTDATAATDPDLIIRQAAGGTARTFYVDNLSFMRNDSTTQPSNVQIGGGINGGPITLFTLDRSTAPPVPSGDSTYFGSMYYDITTGRIQCYESDGWGACGSAPDNIVTLTPEYTGAVLNGTGIGTMTADFCANETTGITFTVGTLCALHETRNFYKWTSPQATSQTYSIYVNYKLPSTFKQFNDDNTIKLTALTDNTTNGSVSYEVYRKNVSGNVITQCGTTTTVTSSNNTWQQVSANGNELSTCAWAGGDYVVFKINVTAKSNANVYVENLDFTYQNR